MLHKFILKIIIMLRRRLRWLKFGNEKTQFVYNLICLKVMIRHGAYYIIIVEGNTICPQLFFVQYEIFTTYFL